MVLTPAVSKFSRLLVLFFPPPHPIISWSVDFYAVPFPLSFTELFFLGPWKLQVQHLKNNFPFKFFYVIIKASIVELTSISSISLLHRYSSVLSPFIRKTVLGASTTFLWNNTWASGNLCFCAYKFNHYVPALLKRWLEVISPNILYFVFCFWYLLTIC